MLGKIPSNKDILVNKAQSILRSSGDRNPEKNNFMMNVTKREVRGDLGSSGDFF